MFLSDPIFCPPKFRDYFISHIQLLSSLGVCNYGNAKSIRSLTLDGQLKDRFINFVHRTIAALPVADLTQIAS